MIVNQSIPCGKLAVEILKYLNSDMIVSSDPNFTEVPVNHLLSQNYPNPFNPVTKINYSVAQNFSNGKENVTMKVFDISGKEIATLINESKPAGNYSVEFDGTDLPSGVYYYSLAIGDYKETKSMILIK
ncbi:MAG: T9SS type A sorting domain-containing protein [Ignavibacteria bacterium]|nr:T9SS type A sorting domain-containing protein [Ignavibacteria bacterium]